MRKIQVNGVEVGGSRTYIIAEAGSNHNGDIEIAKKLIKAAADCNADAVKFQSFRAKDHYSKHTPHFQYLNGQSTYELIKSLEIDREWHKELMKYAEENSITFLSSPCDEDAIEQLAELKIAAYKVASFDLSDLNLIRKMSSYGKPMILSTGMADYADIQRAINTCQEEGNNQIILLQCTSLYPAPAHLSNLASILTMQKAFDCLVGYSDHTLGDHIPIASVTMGACMIEKHFTLDQSLPGPDHSFAIEPVELKDMIRKIRDVESATGDGIKNGPRIEEREMFDKGRRSLHTKRTLSKGEVITKEDLYVKRPGYGISPCFIDYIIGMSVQNDILDDHWIRWEDLK